MRILLLVLLIIVLCCASGCDCRRNEKITGIEISYYRVYRPISNAELDTFEMSKSRLERFRDLMPEPPGPSNMGIGCVDPTGWFTLKYEDGETVKYHFCTSKSKIHGGESSMPFDVPREMYELFIEELEARGYKNVVFGAGVE